MFSLQEATNDLRAKIIHCYSGKELPNLESNTNDRVHDFISLIRTISTKNQPLDMALIVRYLILCIITQVALGYPFGYLQRNEDIYDLPATTRALMPVLELGCNHPWIKSLIESRVVQTIVASSVEDPRGVGAVIGAARKVISERFKPNADQYNDKLGSFKKHGFSQALAESESVLQIIVGADSTATAIRMTFLYILANPPVYTKLQQEIHADMSNCSKSKVISSAEGKRLPYLQACIREGLCIFPPLQGLQNKVAPPQGITISDVFIPRNVEVCTNYHMMMQRVEIFGSGRRGIPPGGAKDRGKRGGVQSNVQDARAGFRHEQVHGSGEESGDDVVG